METRLPSAEQGGILVSKGEYVTAKAGKNVDLDNGEVMSSFRPSDNAKLYASPEDIKSVGYRSRPPVSNLITLQPFDKILCSARANEF